MSSPLFIFLQQIKEYMDKKKTEKNVEENEPYKTPKFAYINSLSEKGSLDNKMILYKPYVNQHTKIELIC